MAIYRCNTCGQVAEMAADTAGTTQPCPHCAQPNPVYDTVRFVSRLIAKYLALRAAHQALQAELDDSQTPETGPAPAAAPDTRLDGIDLHNTSLLSAEVQHWPIEDWFAARRVAVTFDRKAIDTSGFFDEAAMEIARNPELHWPVVEQLRYAQRRGLAQLDLPLKGYRREDGLAVVAFCRRLYEFSLLARVFHDRPGRNLRLSLQPAAPVRDFFAGEWLEWFALMEVLSLCQERRIGFSCARNLAVTFPNEAPRALDLFWLTDRPVCIQCRSGEFRSLIAGFSVLRERLGLAREQFVLCVAGLPDQQASGLTSMYDLTLVSERGLRAHLATLLPGTCT